MHLAAGSPLGAGRFCAMRPAPLARVPRGRAKGNGLQPLYQIRPSASRSITRLPRAAHKSPSCIPRDLRALPTCTKFGLVRLSLTFWWMHEAEYGAVPRSTAFLGNAQRRITCSAPYPRLLGNACRPIYVRRPGLAPFSPTYDVPLRAPQAAASGGVDGARLSASDDAAPTV